MMTRWVRYTLPAAAIMSVASPTYAMQYLSIDEAQKQAFPSATRFVEMQAGRVWKAEAGGRVAGFFIFDRVVGKHLYIDYAVALTPSGAVHSVEILQYRESWLLLASARTICLPGRLPLKPIPNTRSRRQ